MRRTASLVLVTLGGGFGLLVFLAQGLVAKSGVGGALRGAYGAMEEMVGGLPGGGGGGGTGAAFQALNADAQFASFLQEEYVPAPAAGDTIRYRVCKDLSVCYIASRTPSVGIPVPASPPLLLTGPEIPPEILPPSPGSRLGYLAAIPLLGLAGYVVISDNDGGPGATTPPPGGENPPPGGEEENPGTGNPPPGPGNPPPDGGENPPGGETHLRVVRIRRRVGRTRLRR